MAGLLDALFGIRELRKGSDPVLPMRATLTVLGAAVLVDDPVARETVLALAPYSGSSVVSAPEFGSDQHDYAPEGLSDADLVRLTSTVGPGSYTMTGLALSTARLRRKLLLNVSAGPWIILAHESNASAAQNRFLTPTGNDIELRWNGWADVLFDTLSGRVRVLAYSTGTPYPA